MVVCNLRADQPVALGWEPDNPLFAPAPWGLRPDAHQCVVDDPDDGFGSIRREHVEPLQTVAGREMFRPGAL